MFLETIYFILSFILPFTHIYSTSHEDEYTPYYKILLSIATPWSSAFKMLIDSLELLYWPYISLYACNRAFAFGKFPCVILWGALHFSIIKIYLISVTFPLCFADIIDASNTVRSTDYDIVRLRNKRARRHWGMQIYRRRQSMRLLTYIEVISRRFGFSYYICFVLFYHGTLHGHIYRWSRDLISLKVPDIYFMSHFPWWRSHFTYICPF